MCASCVGVISKGRGPTMYMIIVVGDFLALFSVKYFTIKRVLSCNPVWTWCFHSFKLMYCIFSRMWKSRLQSNGISEILRMLITLWWRGSCAVIFLFLFSDVKVEKELKLIGCSVMYSQSLVTDFDDVLTHHQIFPSLVSCITACFKSFIVLTQRLHLWGSTLTCLNLMTTQIDK